MFSKTDVLKSISQYSHENTCVGVSFFKFNKATSLLVFSNTGIFLWILRNFIRTAFLIAHLRWLLQTIVNLYTVFLSGALKCSVTVLLSGTLKCSVTVLLSGALKCSVTVYFTKMLLVKESKNKHSVTLSCLFINKGYNNKHQNTAKYKFGLKVYSLMYWV